jgi:WD40 repeat protein
MNSTACVGILSAHKDAVSCLALVPPVRAGDEACIASGGIDGDVKVWKLNGEMLVSASHATAVTAICAFKDAHAESAQTIVVGMLDGELRVRSLLSMQLLFVIKGYFFNIQCITKIVDIGSSCFATASQDGQLVVWNVSLPLTPP